MNINIFKYFRFYTKLKSIHFLSITFVETLWSMVLLIYYDVIFIEIKTKLKVFPHFWFKPAVTRDI